MSGPALLRDPPGFIGFGTVVRRENADRPVALSDLP